MTKFDELSGILTGTKHDDFFQATFSGDKNQTSSELAEGLSTNAPTSRRIPTVIWKIWIPNVHYNSLDEISFVPFTEGKIKKDGYLLFYFYKAPSDVRKYISVLYV